MTDTQKLIERLRENVDWASPEWIEEAADALEAQQQRIAYLEQEPVLIVRDSPSLLDEARREADSWHERAEEAERLRRKAEAEVARLKALVP